MQTTGAGRRLVIIAIVVLIIVAVIDAAAFFVLPPLDAVRPPTITPGPSPTPAPTNTLVPTPTEIPCEPQVWWDANRETVEAFFVSPIIQNSAEVAADDFSQAVSDQRALRDDTAALGYPPCLSGAHDNLLDAMDSLLNALSTPDAELIAPAEDVSGLPSESVRQFFSLTLDAYDNLVAFINDMDEQGVNFENDDLGGMVRLARAYADANTPNCMATRWVYTEVIPWLALTGIYEQAFNATPMDRDALRLVGFDLQSEGQRIAGDPYPECMEGARSDLLEANDALILIIQGILGNDPSLSADNAPIYTRALDRLEQEIRSSIEFMGNP